MKADPARAARRLCDGFAATAKAAAGRGLGASTTIVLADGLNGVGEELVNQIMAATRPFQQVVGGAAGDDGAFKATTVGGGGPDAHAGRSGRPAHVLAHAMGRRRRPRPQGDHAADAGHPRRPQRGPRAGRAPGLRRLPRIRGEEGRPPPAARARGRSSSATSWASSSSTRSSAPALPCPSAPTARSPAPRTSRRARTSPSWTGSRTAWSRRRSGRPKRP